MKNLGQVTESLDIPKKSDIPTKTSQLTNDSGFLTSAPVTSVNGQTGAVTLALGETNVQADWSVTSTSSDAYIKNKPTSLPASDVSAWAKASSKPTYTASEVGALPTTTTYAGSASVGGPATSANKVNSALTITNGSTSITYDGSSAKSITIEAGGSGGVSSVAGYTGAVTASQLVSALLTGALDYGDKIVAKGTKYIKFQSGLRIQWGSTKLTTSGATTMSVSFATSFSNTNYAITAINAGGTLGNQLYWNAFRIETKGTASFTFKKGMTETTETIDWIAIGF